MSVHVKGLLDFLGILKPESRVSASCFLLEDGVEVASVFRTFSGGSAEDSVRLFLDPFAGLPGMVFPAQILC